MTITQSYQDNLATGWSAVYYPEDGVTLSFKDLEMATEPSPNSSFKIALYWDQNGTGTNMVKIKQIYTKNKSHKFSTNEEPFTAGPNTRVIVRRHIFGSHGSRQTFVKWTAEIL